jgi:DNA-binding NarL/FixJ family response regulator
MELETVMVVDDVALVTRDVRRMLSPVRVVGTTRARDALALAREERPQLALVDLFMPDAFGLDVIRELRREFPELLIVVISGLLDGDLAQQSLNATAAGCIEKPFRRVDLVDAIQKHSELQVPPR